MSHFALGDAVFTIQKGSTRVKSIHHGEHYPVHMENGERYTYDGKWCEQDYYPSAYHSGHVDMAPDGRLVVYIGNKGDTNE